ncbi:FAD/NAD(P)-binding domain-containing protein [Linnemannia elongata AG-77]|uniref:FAD/NAD(P)-binding domain-containing protein n=1 Tax=Linnemannia elongata AG-77 TaxID=1314771 RepID=A0A197JLU3_9FUNG|nr:FAD/NAD(P)-binding domain-containing protein [Linnemannia elongata AG-77]
MTSMCPLARPTFRVIIVGAGLAGLMMGILLDKMGISYTILERAPKVKPLGALMSLNGNILALFDQLGLLEDVMKISKINHSTTLYNEKLEKLAEIGVSDYKDLTGYEYIVFSRPELYEIIRQRVPQEKVLMGKRVNKIRQLPMNGGVEVVCHDHSVYTADILIGADGAYSTIRYHMYKNMTEAGTLPASDAEELAMPYVCMVGTTIPQDPEKYPELIGPVTHLRHVIGNEGPYSWTVITIPGNRFCWSVMAQVTDPEEARQMRQNNLEWRPEATESLVNTIRNYPIAFGGEGAVLGDILDVTPKDVRSKVMLEEKLFETWYDGNIVLIGDACHKDATILANCLYDLEDLSPESILKTFSDYRNQRYTHAKKQVANSQLNAKISSGQWVFSRSFVKSAAYRPQVTFLPMVPDKGSVASLPQKPSKRHQAEQAGQAGVVDSV